MSPSIILIGPIHAGKSTLVKPLASALNRTALELDDLRWAYYAEVGYDPEKADKLYHKHGLEALIAYVKPFEVYSVERVLSDYPTDCVIAFGAGNSHFEDPAMFARAKAALAPFPHVILLLPSPDVEVSMAALRDRLRANPKLSEGSVQRVAGINRDFLEHPSNRLLATHTAYTLGKSIDETCSEIVTLLTDE